MKKIKTYSELLKIKTFDDRFSYLKLSGIVGQTTFGFDRYLNQLLYNSYRWKKIREKVILRDNACDLGIDDYPIGGYIYVHHINPITIEDIENESNDIFDPEFLISASKRTHDAIHFSDESLLSSKIVIRSPNDTCLWKGGVL